MYNWDSMRSRVDRSEVSQKEVKRKAKKNKKKKLSPSNYIAKKIDEGIDQSKARNLVSFADQLLDTSDFQNELKEWLAFSRANVKEFRQWIQDKILGKVKTN